MTYNADMISRVLMSASLAASLTGLSAAGYEGFGTTVGGDQSPVAQVTSLADDGPGSLREAVRQGNRRIVFAKPGTIQLKKILRINQSKLTLDGFNSSVTITGAPVAIEHASDVIVRYLRFRNSPDDNLRIVGGCRRVIVDHCTSTGAGDGALDITIDYDQPLKRPTDITVSWCIFAKTKKAMLVSSANNLSLHHNLFLDNEQRNPQLHDARNFDVRNNVIHRWGIYGLRVRAGSTGNVMFNVLGPGTNPKKDQELALVIMGTGEAKGASGPVHAEGNLGPGNLNLNTKSTAPMALPAPRVTLWTPAQAYRHILQHAGARPLDKIDQAFLKGL
ncbi:MAG: hypothetical protein CMO78_06370 [Verrucomicrobiales bacterium]|nr:hypothetical protein [Verrucomicrobiales bacterium]|tara:strand:- start:1199 stop:2197 length:999 start_codon:yes stop_codon:yes gene_type:complete